MMSEIRSRWQSSLPSRNVGSGWNLAYLQKVKRLNAQQRGLALFLPALILPSHTGLAFQTSKPDALSRQFSAADAVYNPASILCGWHTLWERERQQSWEMSWPFTRPTNAT